MFLWLQLGICSSTPGEFLTKAKEIVQCHKDLETQVTSLQSQITNLEVEQQKLVSNLFRSGVNGL